jgi:hypothetical protein
MSRAQKSTIVLFLVAAGAAQAKAPPSDVIFPAQKLPLTFSHAKHLAKKIDCDFCHDKAPGSRASQDDLIPAEEVCATCHPIDRAHPDGAGAKKSATPCATCHPAFTAGKDVERVVMPPPNLRFDHQAHVSRGVPCTRCHAGVERVDLASRAQLPKMELCLGCHNSGRGKLDAPSRCATCHVSTRDGTLETTFASGTLRPSGLLRGDAHTLDFRTHHAAVARDDEKYCLNCHRQDYCQSCHNGVVKPFDFHGNDYVSRHGIDARRNDPDCGSCHRRQSFCLGCHERLGVTDARTTAQTPFAPSGTRTFHPDGWADPSAAHQPNHHAWQAQRNLRTCVSCHRQETCLECHAAQSGPGSTAKMTVNPHPMGWAGSRRCQALADRNVRVCLRCHAPSDAELHCGR